MCRDLEYVGGPHENFILPKFLCRFFKTVIQWRSTGMVEWWIGKRTCLWLWSALLPCNGVNLTNGRKEREGRRGGCEWWERKRARGGEGVGEKWGRKRRRDKRRKKERNHFCHTGPKGLRECFVLAFTKSIKSRGKTVQKYFYIQYNK